MELIPSVPTSPMSITLLSPISTSQKGKRGELLVFAEILKRGANLYIPIVDVEGVDAIVRRRDGSLAEIQVKSTESEDQAGYFNAFINPRETLWVVCVDLRHNETWIFPSKVFAAYAKKQTSGEYRLALPDRDRVTGIPRKVLLKSHLEAWATLIG